jgi:hypothetical protein
MQKQHPSKIQTKTHHGAHCHTVPPTHASCFYIKLLRTFPTYLPSSTIPVRFSFHHGWAVGNKTVLYRFVVFLVGLVFTAISNNSNLRVPPSRHRWKQQWKPKSRIWTPKTERSSERLGDHRNQGIPSRWILLRRCQARLIGSLPPWKCPSLERQDSTQETTSAFRMDLSGRVRFLLTAPSPRDVIINWCFIDASPVTSISTQIDAPNPLPTSRLPTHINLCQAWHGGASRRFRRSRMQRLPLTPRWQMVPADVETNVCSTSVTG